MYVFGIVVSASDDSLVGRASAALRLQLPELFPEHGFEFVPQEELTEVQPTAREELLFRVLATEVHNEDEELIAECAGPELVGEIQAAVDKIVAAAKRRNAN
jgi:hypothetical protein